MKIFRVRIHIGYVLRYSMLLSKTGQTGCVSRAVNKPLLYNITDDINNIVCDHMKAQ